MKTFIYGLIAIFFIIVVSVSSSMAETKKECKQRLNKKYQKLNKYISSRGQKEYSDEQIKRKVEEACSSKKDR